jgi:hypothetical protein
VGSGNFRSYPSRIFGALRSVARGRAILIFLRIVFWRVVDVLDVLAPLMVAGDSLLRGSRVFFFACHLRSVTTFLLEWLERD